MTPGSRSAARWRPVDAIVAAYTAWSGLLILRYAGGSTTGWILAGTHVVILASLIMIPGRGAAWEARAPASAARRALHGFVRFVRYAYPLPLALFFFEEGAFTVNMIYTKAPYWFEPRLYAADLALFGQLPSRLLAPWVNPALTELMSVLYAAYYVILVGGLALAYVGAKPPAGAPRRTPAPGFDVVLFTLTTAFLLAFAAYPWIPARGPWENPELVAGLPPLRGYAATLLVDRIIAHGAVSGNCFPSGHVAGAWAVVFGLTMVPAHRRAAGIAALLSAGMSVACVYTRYHHVVDVPAGFACAALAAIVAFGMQRRASRAP